MDLPLKYDFRDRDGGDVSMIGQKADDPENQDCDSIKITDKSIWKPTSCHINIFSEH